MVIWYFLEITVITLMQVVFTVRDLSISSNISDVTWSETAAGRPVTSVNKCYLCAFP